uniref:hypothetical protein n=1 Tax=Anabaena sp. 4-3 TaxID=1811979 RepID=UPI00082D70BC
MFYSIFFLILFLVGPGLAAIALYYSLAVRWQLLLLGVCILYGVLPFIIAGIGLILAQRFGCQVDIGISYKCPENPQMAGLVTGMIFIGAWGGIITIPSGVLGVIGMLISLVMKTRT